MTVTPTKTPRNVTLLFYTVTGVTIRFAFCDVRCDVRCGSVFVSSRSHFGRLLHFTVVNNCTKLVKASFRDFANSFRNFLNSFWKFANVVQTQKFLNTKTGLYHLSYLVQRNENPRFENF